MNQTERHSPASAFALGTFCLFLAGFLLLVLFGARSYQAVVSRQSGNNDTRALLTYLSTVTSGGDSEGGISVGAGPEGDMLVIRESGSDYVTRIYLYEGSLVEEFSAADSDLAPENASVLGDTETFSAEYAAEDLIRITTDRGSALIRVRSEAVIGE